MDKINIQRCCQGYGRDDIDVEQVYRRLAELKVAVLMNIPTLEHASSPTVNQKVSIITELSHNSGGKAANTIYIGPKVEAIYILNRNTADMPPLVLTAINGISVLDTIYSTVPITLQRVVCTNQLIVPHDTSFNKAKMEAHGWCHYYSRNNSDISPFNKYQLDVLHLFPSCHDQLDFYFRASGVSQTKGVNTANGTGTTVNTANGIVAANGVGVQRHSPSVFSRTGADPRSYLAEGPFSAMIPC